MKRFLAIFVSLLILVLGCIAVRPQISTAQEGGTHCWMDGHFKIDSDDPNTVYITIGVHQGSSSYDSLESMFTAYNTGDFSSTSFNSLVSTLGVGNGSGNIVDSVVFSDQTDYYPSTEPFNNFHFNYPPMDMDTLIDSGGSLYIPLKITLSEGHSGDLSDYLVYLNDPDGSGACEGATNPQNGNLLTADGDYRENVCADPEYTSEGPDGKNITACNNSDNKLASCNSVPKGHREQCATLGAHYYNMLKDGKDEYGQNISGGSPFSCTEPQGSGDFKDISQEYVKGCTAGEVQSICDGYNPPAVYVRVLGGNNGTCLSFLGLLKTLINYALLVSSLVAAFMLLRGGFKYTTSRGDPAGLFEARDEIMHATIGVILIACAYIIVLFLEGSFGFLGLDLLGPFRNMMP